MNSLQFRKFACAFFLAVACLPSSANPENSRLPGVNSESVFVSRSGMKLLLRKSEGGEGRGRHALLHVLDESKNPLFTLAGPGAGRESMLLPEIQDFWDEGGLASVLVKYDMTDAPQQPYPTPGARGLCYHYDWYIFDQTGGKTAGLAGFETRESAAPGHKHVILLKERIFADDPIFNTEGSLPQLWEVKFKSQFEVQGIRKAKQTGQADSESFSWTWHTFSKNGQVVRKVDDYDFFENRYFRKAQIERFLQDLPGLQKSGKLPPNRIWRMVQCMGGIEETQTLLTRFVGEPQRLEILKRLFEDGKKNFEAEEAAFKAAEPERLRALVEEEKRKEEARRQKVKEMDAKADKLDLELYEQSKRENEREQKEREEEMAE